MSSLSEGRPVPAQAALRWVSTNNPFYVVSAGLFLAGLWLSFGDPRNLDNTWAMIVGLGGYTLLLAATAFVLVRHMNLWDDARTVLLLVVLMFLATSVTFDEVLVVAMVDPQNGVPIRGILCFAAGLVFAVAVSEGLLRGIGLELPAGFRMPYYLILALFFLYPLVLCPFLANPHGEALQWGLFAFSTVAGLVFLTLLPAIRRGARYVRDNGSPWPWPLYPWSLFVFLAFAVVGRAFLLCWSLHPIGGINVIFGPYFVVPFGFALAILLMELGLNSSHRRVMNVALAAPIGLLLLAMLGHRSDPTYQGFLNIFTSRLGADPVFCTLLAALGFYVYAAMRRVAYALELMTATTAALAFIHPHILREAGIQVQPAPLVLAATLFLGLGVLRRQSWSCLLGSLGLILGLAMAIPSHDGYSSVRWSILFHTLILVFMLIATVFDDDLATLLRHASVFMILFACLGMMLVPVTPPSGLPGWLLELYAPAMAGLLLGYGVWRRQRFMLAVAVLIYALWALVTGWQIYRAVRQLIVGIDYLVLSALVFILAIVVSLTKAGVLSRWLAAWRARY